MIVVGGQTLDQGYICDLPWKNASYRKKRFSGDSFRSARNRLETIWKPFENPVLVGLEALLKLDSTEI